MVWVWVFEHLKVGGLRLNHKMKLFPLFPTHPPVAVHLFFSPLSVSVMYPEAWLVLSPQWMTHLVFRQGLQALDCSLYVIFKFQSQLWYAYSFGPICICHSEDRPFVKSTSSLMCHYPCRRISIVTVNFWRLVISWKSKFL